MTLSDVINKLRERADGQGEWLNNNAPTCFVDQGHLDEGTPERAYWHYGYRVALLDAIKLLSAIGQ